MDQPKIELELNPPTAEEVGRAMITLTNKKELDAFLTETFYRLERDKEAFYKLFIEAFGPMTEEEDEIAVKNLEGLEVFRSPRPYCHMEYVVEPIMESTITDKERDEMLHRMMEYCQRMIKAIEALESGQPLNESVREAYNEIFLESKTEQWKAFSLMSKMIEHLLKLGYCNSINSFQNNKGTWIRDVNKPKRNLLRLLEWEDDPQYTTLINYIKANITKMYNEGISLYEDACNKYPDLEEGKSLIPSECPWTLDELMDNSVAELLQKLPNVKNKLE